MEEKFELKNVKGTADFLPEEQIVRNQIINELKTTFELYGYLPLETPILCYYDLLASKYAGGSEILKEVYKLKDQGNRDLGLRYDLTVPFSKVLGMMKEPILPFRRYEIGKVFRDGPIKLGRNREFYQCDIDVCGIEVITAEAEMFSLSIYAYHKLGIDIDLRWNNRKFLSGIMIECNISKISETILIVDKLEKIGKEDVFKELKKLGLEEKSINKLFDYFELTINEIETLKTTNETLLEGIKEIIDLNNYLKEMHLIDNCTFKPFLARGLEIYTGTVWEVFDKKNRVTSSLGGGGRFDNIITNFIDNGTKYPAVGMCFGLEPIYAILKEEKKFIKSPYDLYIYSFVITPNILSLAQTLRQNKIKVIVEMNNIKLKKAMNYANKNKIPYVLIVGEDEIKDNLYSFKNMETGIQETLKIDEIIEKLNK